MKLNPRITLATTLFTFIALATPAIAAPAAENWENHCAKCHGEDGKGQTKAGRKLKVKDYTSAEVQAKMTDEEMFKATADGVMDENGKEKMKAYKDELTTEEITGLVVFTRAFKK